MRILQDVRYGFRLLIKSPGFTVVAILALALGIGANTAIFSVVNGVLLRPLPYRDPGRLMTIIGGGMTVGPSSVSPADFTEWRNQNRVFEDLVAYTGGSFNLAGSAAPERVDGIAVSASFFPVLGIEPAFGRAFSDEENQPGRNKVAVIGHDLWKRAFNSDTNILGKSLKLDEESYTVVGVMPEGFRFVMKADLVTPVEIDPTYRRNSFLRVIARLKSDSTIEQAKAEMEVIAGRLDEANPRQSSLFKRLGADLLPLHELTAKNSRLALVVLSSAVGFVLLIACANLANLLLARASTRRKEMAIRAAVGARRLHLIRQMLIESVLLSLAGGAAGLLLAAWGIDLLLDFAPPTLPRVNAIGIDVSVLGFTFLISVGTGLLFGLVPALQASRLSLTEALKEGARTSHAGFIGLGLRSLLVVGQVALALVLLICAGLMLNSFVRLLDVDKGFNADNLLTLNVALPETYRTKEQIKNFYQETLQRIESLPGVANAGLVGQLPLGGMMLTGDFLIEGQPPLPEGTFADKIVASQDYFRAMRIPLVAGRRFGDGDVNNSKGVVIINGSFARKFFEGDDVVGKRLSLDEDPKGQPIWREIVGIVGDVKQKGLASDLQPAIFLPYTQTSNLFWLRYTTFVARTDVEPTTLAAAVQHEIQRVDPNLPLYDIKTMRQVISDSVSDPRFNALLLAVFAGLALVLATVGIYGVVSYSVTQRTREMGIRQALGADRRDIMRLVMGQGLRMALAGIALGVALAFAVTRVIESFLFGVRATDTATFIVLPVILAGVALGACYVPARRATKVDPMEALRYE
jgi:putative ABC transport system permease protein